MDNDNFLDLYDEFGTYIGPELNDVVGDGPQETGEAQDGQARAHSEDSQDDFENENLVEDQVVLHEDKKYYPEMGEVYKGAETLIMEEDAQDISEPMVKQIKPKEFDLVEKKMPKMFTSKTFMANLSKNPQLIRNIALVGHLHHGKSMFMDILVEQTHQMDDWAYADGVRYSDTRKDEQERKISLKSSAMSLVLPDSKEKSYLFNIMDTPGHPNFNDEVCCSLRISDGAVLVVDVIEGVMVGTERILKYIVQENLNFCVVLNKIDRLPLEMKMPAADAYLKLKHTLEEINGILATATAHLGPEQQEKYKISPLKGNVIFASGHYYFSFSLQSFASQYATRYPTINPDF
jgi:U5 small nuclear ribonucleoprotein component